MKSVILCMTLCTLGLAGCSGEILDSLDEESRGNCTGTIAGASVNLDIIPESEYHGTPLGTELITMAYGVPGELTIVATLSNFPLDGEEGPHTLPLDDEDTDNVVSSWNTLVLGDEVDSGTVTFKELGLNLSTRLKGDFVYELASGDTLNCSFDLFNDSSQEPSDDDADFD